MTEEEKVAVSPEEEAAETPEEEGGEQAGDETEEGESATSEEEREASAEETGDEEEAAEKAKPKREGGFQKRIRKLNQRLSAKQEETDYWRERALAKSSSSEPAKEPAVAKAKPRPEDFRIEETGEYDQAAFLEALTDWKTEQAIAKREAERQTAELRAEAQRMNAAYVKREEAFAAQVDDFDEVITDALATLAEQSGPGRNTIAGVLAETEEGPALLYYFGQNPDELEKISQLRPSAAGLALGRIADKLAQNTGEKGQETRTPSVSKAPKPFTPVKKPSGGKAIKATDAESDKLSTEEWLARRRAELRSRA